MAEVVLKSLELPSGETVGYRERGVEGEGPTLLLVHGNMNSSKHWDVLMESLDPRIHLVAIDLPGFGISTYHKPIDGLFDYAEVVKQFVDALGLHTFALIGWSTGGGIAMKFAADYPEQVEKLILLSSMSTRGYPFYADGADGNPDLTKRLRTHDEISALSRTKLISDAGARQDRAFMRWLFEVSVYNLNKPAEEQFEQYVDDILTQRNLADIYHGLNTFNISSADHEAAPGSGDVSRIKAPVLVIWGANDLVIQESMTSEMMEDLGDRAELVVLENCGHSPLVDALPALTGKVDRFVLGTE
ncbi:intracellular short-chain-length polyhydroxyalkanoate depolymerase [Paenibacillus planticolens]|uniref:Alpha/beta fold hydrolase n=1 Tax=Paenibacillus planticolens TaxID=2654976 RepID=A0ABX1ZMZ9_9BACL|nr:alpha/beta hydrolase [Paenibacillus planticolens]NOV00395.1 alpha/beta fold hydrolase [Paenibacillus planticolens]